MNKDHTMRAKRLILATFVIVGVGYLAYPYAVLYHLNIAVRASDDQSLRSMVDWYAVREGLKEDLCDMVLEEPTPRPANELAPFGESFVRGITATQVDQSFTPAAIMTMVHGADDGVGPAAHLEWAFFDNPTHFVVDVRVDGTSGPLQIEMNLRDDMRWHVSRLHLPNEMLEGAPVGPVVEQAAR
jgi:hypothetical protein